MDIDICLLFAVCDLEIYHHISMPKKDITMRLLSIYNALYRAYGPQHWWPGETPFEVMVGAVLTQNTAWSNVEKAIANLKKHRLLTPSRMSSLTLGRLATLIRPSGYYNVKAKHLQNLLVFIQDHYRGSIKKLCAEDGAVLRQKLLNVSGIGEETADSILLYAAGKPFFVVDAYTRRILSRHGLITQDADYLQMQRLFMEAIPADLLLYNEYHALIVKLGKELCRKSRPLCSGCPLERFLPV